MTHSRLVIRTLVALLVVTSVVGATGIVSPVAAQTQTNNSTTNGSPGDDDGYSPGDGWGHWAGSNNSSAGGSGGGFGIGPKEWAADTADWLMKQAGNAFRWSLRASMSLWIGTPYGHQGPQGIPTNDPFTTIHKELYGNYVFPAIVLFLGMFVMMSAAAMSASTIFSGGRITRWLGRMGMAILVVGLAYDFTNLMQHLANSVAWAFAPKPQELTNSMGGILKLGAGPTVGIVGLYIFGWSEALILSLVYGFRQAVLLFAPVMMPIILLIAYAAPHSKIRMAGSALFWQWFGLVWVPIPIAILLRGAYVLNWDFGVGGIIGFVMTLAIFGIALGLPFVVSYGFFKFPASITTSAAAVGGAAASKADYFHERYDRFRAEDDDGISLTSNSSTTSPEDRAVAADGGITGEQAGLLAERMNRSSRTDDTQTAERIRALHDATHSSDQRFRTRTRKHVVRTRAAREHSTPSRSESADSYEAKPRYRLSRTGGDD